MSPYMTNIEPTSATGPNRLPFCYRDIHGMKPRTELRGIRQYKEKLALIARRTDLQIAAVLQGR